MRIRSAHGTTIASSTQNYADQAVNLSSEPCGKPRYRLHPTLDFCYGNRNMLAGTFGGRSMITITLLAAPLALTLVEFCSAAPEPPATELPEWHWRMVDGKKCISGQTSSSPGKIWFGPMTPSNLISMNVQRSEANGTTRRRN